MTLMANRQKPIEIGADVAVLIVNWNSGALLEKCMAALHEQTVAPGRIIVLDSGSEDDSCRRIDFSRPGHQVINLSEDFGFAVAANVAIKAAEGFEWVVLLNPDALPTPTWLEALLRAAREHPTFSSFGSHMLQANGKGLLDGTGDIFHVSGRPFRRDHGAPEAERRRAAGEMFSICGAAALYRRQTILEFGGFDEDFFCYIEDLDLGFRLRLAGERCRYVPEAVVFHVGSGTTGRYSDFSVYHAHRNLVWNYVKNMPAPLLWFYLPEHLLLNVFSLVWFTLQGRPRVIFKSKWDALKGLPKMLRKRRQVQARRKVGSLALRRSMATGLPFRSWIEARSHGPS